MRPWLRLALRAAVTVLALLLARRIAQTLAASPAPLRWQPGWAALALAVQLAVTLLLALRLRLMLALLDPGRAPPPLWQLARLTWAGLALSQVALGVVGGDAARVWMLAALRPPAAEALRRVILDRVIGLGALVLLGALAWATVLPAPRAVLLLGAALGATAALIALAARFAARARLLAEFAALGTTAGGWACLGLAAASHLLSVVAFWTAARAVGLEPPLIATLIAVPAGLLASALPASLGGWGLREAAIAATYAALGVPFTGAVPASVAYGVSLAVAAAPGLAFLTRRAPLPAGGRGA